MKGNSVILAFLMAILCMPQYVTAQSYTAPGGNIYREEGMASWYGNEFDGRPTASGEIFNSTLFTAAHPELPFGTFLRVTNKYNNRQVTVKVNDRGPFVPSRISDLSKAAAEHIDMINAGVAPVIIETLTTTYMPSPSQVYPLPPEPPAPAEPAPGLFPYPPITLNVYQPPTPPPPAPPPPPPPQPQPQIIQPVYPMSPDTQYQYQTMPQYQLPPQTMYPPQQQFQASPYQPMPDMYQYQTAPQYQPMPPQPLPPMAQMQPPQPDPYQSLPQSQIQELYPTATIYPPTNVPPQSNIYPPTSIPPSQPLQMAPPSQMAPPLSQSLPPVSSTLPPLQAAPLPAAPPQITPTESLPPLPSSVSGGVKLIPSINPLPGSIYKLQVGSYKEPRHAVDAFGKLKQAGLNPSYEPNGDSYRVVLAGVNGLEMQSTLDKIARAGFREALIREER
jgi:rare lipoprotein A